jgi:hypothetical protein
MRCAAEAIAFALLVAACDAAESSDAEEDSSSSDSGAMEWMTLDDRPCPEESFLTWENFGGPFVLSYCATCHGSGLPADMRQNAPIDIDFETVDDVRMHADRIWLRAADQNSTMPPAGAPPADMRTALGEWLACGAPTDAD